MQTANTTLTAVQETSKAEQRVDGKVDGLSGALAAFVAQQASQRTLDEAQTSTIATIRNDLTKLEQAFVDHVRNDEALIHRAPGGN